MTEDTPVVLDNGELAILIANTYMVIPWDSNFSLNATHLMKETGSWTLVD